MAFEEEFINAVGRMSDEFGAAVMQRAGELVLQSIRDGSSLTGAPGSPIDTRALYEAWEMVTESDGVLVYNPLPYAWGIEHGLGPHGPITLRSHVGGFHSVELTAASWDRIVSQAAKDVLGGSAIGGDEGGE